MQSDPSPPPAFVAAVGSTNTPKIAAVRSVILTRWPGASIVPVAVASDVSEQPWGAEETAAGARHRAVAAQKQIGADLGVGLEGGVEEGPGGLYVCGWAAIVTVDGRWGLASSGRALLPPELALELRSGVELGVAIDRWAGRHGVRHDVGTIGILTDGLIQRHEAFAEAIKLAMASVFHPEWYPYSYLSHSSVFSHS